MGETITGKVRGLEKSWKPAESRDYKWALTGGSAAGSTSENRQEMTHFFVDRPRGSRKIQVVDREWTRIGANFFTEGNQDNEDWSEEMQNTHMS